MRTYRTSFSDELGRVTRASRFFERWAEHLREHGHSEQIAELAHYYGARDTTTQALVRFKGLFFATRMEPVLAHIERFTRERGRAPRALDLGCGYGLETAMLAAAGADMEGMDASAMKIERARRTAPLLVQMLDLEAPPRFFVGNVFHYSPSSPYELIYSSATLHHIEPAREACVAIAGLLAPGGRFFLSEENGLSPLQQLAVQSKIGWCAPRIEGHMDPESGLTTRYGNENIRPAFLWRRYFTQAGLVPEFVKYCRFLPPLRANLRLLLHGERLVRGVPGLAQLTAIGFTHAFSKPVTEPF